MPNWCNNILVVRPSDESKEAQEQFQEFLKRIEANMEDNTVGENMFNRLLPMPDDLRITSGSSTTYGRAVFLSQNGHHEELDAIHQYPWAQEFGTREELIAHLIETKQADVVEGRKSVENVVKHGAKDWYDWSVKNWGTKWDTGKEVYVTNFTEDEIVMSFSTAWAPPNSLFCRIGQEEFDKLYFELEYEEPGCAFEGTLIVEDGECSDDQRDYDATKECEDCCFDVEECEWEGEVQCPCGVQECDFPEEDCPAREAMEKNSEES
jgi:hypothetical protein